MTVDDLIELHGVERLHTWVKNQIGTTSTYKKYVCHDSVGNLTGIINRGNIHVQTLINRLNELLLEG